MENSRLIQVLKTFSKKEMDHLGLFIKSPFFNHPAHVDSLVDYLIALFPNFDKLTREDAFKKLFPKRQEFNVELINNIYSNLLKQVEVFMAHYQLQNQDFLKKQLTIDFYNQKPLHHLFEKRCLSLLHEIEKSEFEDSSEHLQSFQINYEYYFHPDTPKLIKDIPIIKDMLFQFENYYAAIKLKLATELTIRQSIFSEQYDFYLLEETLHYVEANNLPFLDLYKSIFQLVSSHTDQLLYDDTKKLFLKYHRKIHVKHRVNILNILVNQANKLVFAGFTEYRKTHFELYKIGLGQGLFTLTGQMNDAIYYNIVATAAILKKFKFAKQFINKYQSSLHPTHKDDVTQISQAFLYFHQKDYIKADQLFVQHKFSKQRYKLLANSLHLRCLYEATLLKRSYITSFTKFASTFKKYIDRNKLLSNDRKTAYYNLIKATKLMVRFREVKRTVRSKKLDEIKSFLQQDIIAKEWLEEKQQQL